ncbi:MAG: hypothetical protein C0483_05550 [Pirellula sp.]|nr:hypothetical protein [Pirellula sp.]
MVVEPEPSSESVVDDDVDMADAASRVVMSPAPPPNPRRGQFLFGLLLAAICFFVYRGTFAFDLLTWDDNQHVTENEYFQKLTWRSWAHFWAYSYIFLYIPVSYNFFACEVWIAQWFPTGDPAHPMNPAVFHIGNVLVHLGCTLAAYRLMVRLTCNAWAAFFGALLFCVHPLQVESVAWVGETRGTLSTLFSFLAAGLYLRYVGLNPTAGMFADAAYEPLQRRSRDYWLGLLCFGLALLSKPSAASLPLILLVIDVILLRRSLLRAIYHLIPWFVAAAVITLMTKYYQKDSYMFGPAVAPLIDRPFIAGDAYAFYLQKLVWPLEMAFDYGRTPHLVRELPGFWRAWLLPSVTALIFSMCPRRRVWLGCYAIFIAAILPVSGIVPFLYQSISTTADRYMYVPMFGFGLMAAAWLATRRSSLAPAIVAAVVLGLLAHRTVDQCRYWRDDWVVFRHGIEVNPLSYMAHLNLGGRYRKEKQYEPALRNFARVLEIRPDYFWADYDRGTCFMALHRYDDAIKEYKSAFDKYPSAFEVHVGLADAYKVKERFDEAERWYRKAVKTAPDNVVPHLGLGEFLMMRGRIEEANKEFDVAAELAPESPDVPRRRGRALVEANRPAEAAPYLEAWVAAAPDSAGAHNELASCYYLLSKFALAVEQGAVAVRLDPKLFEAQYNYGLALAAVGKTAEARTQFEQALALIPPGTKTAAEVRESLDSLR